jgi:CBS domain-containing membrane protein
MPFGYLNRMADQQMRVCDVMTKEIITLSPSQHLHSVDDLMKVAGIRHVPVVDDGRLVGIVTQRDLFRAAMSSVLEFRDSAARGWLERIRVAEVMTSPVVTATPDWPIGRAIDTMLEHAIGCLPVVERDRLVGLVTETTLLRLLARMVSGGVVAGRVP